MVSSFAAHTHHSVQLLKILTRNKHIFEKKFQDFGATNTFVHVIVTSAVMAFRILHCDANTFVSAVTRSGQIERV